MPTGFTKYKFFLVPFFSWMIILFMTQSCFADTQEPYPGFLVKCVKEDSCDVIYKKNNFKIVDGGLPEPNYIDFHKGLYQINYSCGTACSGTFLFKKPNKVSGPFHNLIDTSPDDKYAIFVDGTEIYIATIFPVKIVKKLVVSEVPDILVYFKSLHFNKKGVVLIMEKPDDSNETISVNISY